MFSLELGDPAGATLADPHAEAAILDDDLRTLSVADVELTEGNTGQANATFTLSLSGPASVPVAVDYQTEDGTAAAAGGHFVATSGTATFPLGTTTVHCRGSGQRRHRPRAGRGLHPGVAQPAERDPRGDRPGSFLDTRHRRRASLPPGATGGGVYDDVNDRLMGVRRGVERVLSTPRWSVSS